MDKCCGVAHVAGNYDVEADKDGSEEYYRE
jgi:hypothetical protein